MFGIKNVSGRHKPDFLIIVFIFVIIAFGLIMLASASSDLATTKFGDSYYYLTHQIIYGLVPGLALFLFASNFYYQNWKKISVWLFIFSIVLLLLIFSPFKVSAGGADRWLKFGPLVFQPSEVLKVSFVIYLAAWLSGSEKRKNNFLTGYLPFLGICGLTSFLLLIQPSTSTVAILMSSALIIYFASGARISYIISTIVLGAALLLLVSYITPYRWQRIKSFIDPNQNTQGASYHINQALNAIGSGNLLGVGYGQSVAKIYYLPEPIGDSIFVVIAEELGFVGSVALLISFLVLIIRVFILSMKTRDKFGQMLLLGFGSIIGIQAFMNMGAISGLLPLTGVTLPFISYGGTALAIFMLISGIIVNISKNN
ncbi:MAG: putative lipid II flippase FtsW [Patescibacteria group bacterium]|nr:putative lipid II flippase FtsW [Patescibacteria group bacterium]